MRGALSLDLVLSVLFLFQIFAISDALSTSMAAHAESTLASAPCKVAATAAALSYSSSSSVFGASSATLYDYGAVDPDYNVTRTGNKVVVQVKGLEGNYVCVEDIP